MAKDTDNHIFTIPNILSLLRILLIPVFILLMLQNKVVQALIVFLLAALTDLLDGVAARIWQQKTRLGTYLDPAADKLLMASTFIILSLPSVSVPNTIPIWLMLAVILRDLYVVSGTFVFVKLVGKTEITPSILGKACTVVEMGLLVLVLLFNALEKSLAFLEGVYIFTLVLALLSAVHYTFIGIRAYSQKKQQ